VLCDVPGELCCLIAQQMGRDKQGLRRPTQSSEIFSGFWCLDQEKQSKTDGKKKSLDKCAP